MFTPQVKSPSTTIYSPSTLSCLPYPSFPLVITMLLSVFITLSFCSLYNPFTLLNQPPMHFLFLKTKTHIQATVAK